MASLGPSRGPRGVGSGRRKPEHALSCTFNVHDLRRPVGSGLEIVLGMKPLAGSNPASSASHQHDRPAPAFPVSGGRGRHAYMAQVTGIGSGASPGHGAQLLHSG